jgi:hypothetical protein
MLPTPPGNYAVRVKVGTHEETTQLVVLADPHSAGTEASIRAQVQFARQVLAEENQAADLINHLEWTRRQVEDLITMWNAQGEKYATVVAAAKEFELKVVALEGKLIDIHNTGRSEDAFREPVQLYERISWMVGPMVGAPGSGSGGGDLAPTTQQVAANEEFKQQLAQIQAEFKQFVESTTPSFNAALKQNHITAAIEP